MSAPPVAEQGPKEERSPETGDADDVPSDEQSPGLPSVDGTGPSVTGPSTTPVGEHNCGPVECGGHALCGLAGVEICRCQAGYRYDEDTGECELDRGCIELSTSGDMCRQQWESVPAVALHVDVRYCGGPPVEREQIEAWTGSADPRDWFVFTDDGDLRSPSGREASYAAVQPEVERFLTLVVDVSASFRADEGVGGVLPRLREFVADIAARGDETVLANLVVFGLTPVELVPRTRDLGAIEAALAQLEADPRGAFDLVGGRGTALYATARGAVTELRRAIEFRQAVTDRGVLNRGLMLIVTDGREASGQLAPESLGDGDLIDVLTVAVGDDIRDDTLATVGPDGFILAPNPERWQAALTEAGERFDGYERSSALIAYCSSRSHNDHRISVSLAVAGIELEQRAASCVYQADAFSGDPDQPCSLTHLMDRDSGECGARACGGLMACGACADDACCSSDGQCMAPQGQIDEDCGGDDQRCDGQGLVCVSDSDDLEAEGATCAEAARLGEGCDPNGEVRCRPGFGVCRILDEGPVESEGSEDDEEPPLPGICVPPLADGSPCDSHTECESLHCGQPPRTRGERPDVCLPGMGGAPVSWACDDHDECERGSHCDDGRCQVREFVGEACEVDANCVHGGCEYGECTGGQCFVAWEDVQGGVQLSIDGDLIAKGADE